MNVMITGSEPITLDFTDKSTMTLALDSQILLAAALEEDEELQEQAEHEPFIIIDYPLDLKVVVDNRELSLDECHRRLCGFILKALVDRAMLVRARELARDIEDEDLAVFSPAELEELKNL